ncbi:hypothetical protein AWA1501_13520 [Lactiplantibacillus pentosus]|nr:hypothetical protein SN13T_3331 [Lactiplantibacillus plantarum]GEO50227.1 hypothetical protein LPE01_15880 [Lactiplantibacillus pentosus]GIP69189.1 hypothetical protein AWA1501_13520 [Lactiplantibacillus pentosus]
MLVLDQRIGIQLALVHRKLNVFYGMLGSPSFVVLRMVLKGSLLKFKLFWKQQTAENDTMVTSSVG